VHGAATRPPTRHPPAAGVSSRRAEAVAKGLAHTGCEEAWLFACHEVTSAGELGPAGDAVLACHELEWRAAGCHKDRGPKIAVWSPGCACRRLRRVPTPSGGRRIHARPAELSLEQLRTGLSATWDHADVPVWGASRAGGDVDADAPRAPSRRPTLVIRSRREHHLRQARPAWTGFPAWCALAPAMAEGTIQGEH
jgi:hypothetical protein